MSVLGFVDDFLEVHTKMPDRAFAFVLGAGVSKTSGIRGAAEMAGDWVKRLHLHSGSSQPCEAWANAQTLAIDAYDSNDLAAAYSGLYARAFGSDPARGYAYLEDEMKNADPSYGYAVLARILSTTQHKVVVTTNFDNLVADSLSIFSKTFPLVCGHESLAGFVRAQLRRPLVVKVHRDLLLAPKSAPSDLASLPEGYGAALDKLFQHYTPVVIGYGGNDGSLMGYLQRLQEGFLTGGVYWCYWDGGPPPNADIRRFVARQKGCLVPIPGFDELMLLLAQKLEYDVPDKLILDRAQQRAARIVSQVQELKNRLDKPPAPPVPAANTGPALAPAHAPSVDRTPDPPGPPSQEPVTAASAETLPAVRQALDEIMQRTDGERRWWQWEQLAQKEPDPATKEQIYEQALKAMPGSAPLLGNYANFLRTVRKDYERAEWLYERAIEAGPKHATGLGNYASFLAHVRKDHDRAEQFYERAIEADPKHANNLGNYGLFLMGVRKDHDRAEKLYERAIEADPKDASSLGNYANFLWTIREDYDRAEKLYERAIEADPKHANNLGNYAVFVTEVRKDHDRAEKLYERAIEADPKHANQLGNYARFELQRGRIEHGLELLDRSLALSAGLPAEPLHAECWMYAYCHRPPGQRVEALQHLKGLIAAGTRTGDWNFSGVVAKAIERGHDASAWLPKLADVLAGRAEPSVLDGWEAWANAVPIQAQV